MTAYTYTDEAIGVTTVVEDEELAAALREALPEGRPVIWRTLEDVWNADGTERRIIRAEVTNSGR